MANIHVIYNFLLENGSKKTVTVKDVKENIDPIEILAFADLLIAKNSQLNQSPIVSLEDCSKYIVDEEKIK